MIRWLMLAAMLLGAGWSGAVERSAEQTPETFRDWAEDRLESLREDFRDVRRDLKQ